MLSFPGRAMWVIVGEFPQHLPAQPWRGSCNDGGLFSGADPVVRPDAIILCYGGKVAHRFAMHSRKTWSIPTLTQQTVVLVGSLDPLRHVQMDLTGMYPPSLIAVRPKGQDVSFPQYQRRALSAP